MVKVRPKGVPTTSTDDGTVGAGAAEGAAVVDIADPAKAQSSENKPGGFLRLQPDGSRVWSDVEDGPDSRAQSVGKLKKKKKKAEEEESVAIMGDNVAAPGPEKAPVNQKASRFDKLVLAIKKIKKW